jgi:hypothetical protein
MQSENHRILWVKKGHILNRIPGEDIVDNWAIPAEDWANDRLQFFTYIDVVLSEKKYFKGTVSVGHRSLSRLGTIHVRERGRYERLEGQPLPGIVLHGNIGIGTNSYSVHIYSDVNSQIHPGLGKAAYDMFIEAREKYLGIFKNEQSDLNNT